MILSYPNILNATLFFAGNAVENQMSNVEEIWKFIIGYSTCQKLWLWNKMEIK